MKRRTRNEPIERLRTRLVQGAGRCTRGPLDSALVIVDGNRLLRYLSREDVRAAMPADLQAEIGFGLDNSTVPAADLLQLAESAFDQDDVWQQDAEPEIAERRGRSNADRQRACRSGGHGCLRWACHR